MNRPFEITWSFGRARNPLRAASCATSPVSHLGRTAARKGLLALPILPALYQ